MSARHSLRAAFGRMKALPGDEDGASAIYAGVVMSVLFGAGSLAIDLSRYMTLNTELQSAADAAALAGAGELNGLSDARLRAAAAVQNAFGPNTQTWATGEAAVTVAGWRFLASLDPDVEAANDAEARFIAVTVAPREAQAYLAPVLMGDVALDTGATAVAGFTQVACKIPPLMICNPFEPDTAGPASPETPFSSPRGQQILVKSHSGPSGGQWAPGTFGLLDPPSGHQGAKETAEALATGNPPGCYSVPLGVRPGQVNSMRSALNVRFDIYENPYFNGASYKNDWNYRPAVNVTKGYTGTGCGSAPAASASEAVGLPRDKCFRDGTCDRFGDAQWQDLLDEYWATNHGGAPPMAFEARYDVYRWEIENSQIPVDTNGGTTTENGHPACYGGPAPTADPDRRALDFAVVNCRKWEVKGNFTNVAPVAFVQAFLTEPVSSSTDIYLETLKVDNAKNSEVVHDIIQLYR